MGTLALRLTKVTKRYERVEAAALSNLVSVRNSKDSGSDDEARRAGSPC